MFISMNWIAEYVDLSDYDRQARLDLIHRFSLSTAEVENDIDLKGSELSGVVVAEIKSVEAHPSSAKLHLLKVDCGGEALVDVVCGAPNVRVGMKTCFAKVGAHVAGIDIAPRPLAGHMSYGMCCSEKELGISDDNSGIMEVDPSVPNGTDIKELWPIEDIVFEVDNKSLTNRPDLWGHYGIAREFSALTGRPLKPLTLADLSVYEALPALDMKIEDPRCLRYSCLAVEGITKNVSPVAIRIRLYYCGMRAINLLADLTNYLMLEVGQPMHAFDSRKLERIRIRRFDTAFPFRTLDGVERKIDPETLMICNGDQPVGIAGIMGGLDSEIVADTSRLTLESANFDAASIRKATVRLGHRTDSSARYEKSLDPEMTVIAIARFLRLLQDIDGGVQVVSSLTDEYARRYPQITLDFDKSFVDRYAGISIGDEDIVRPLRALGFLVDADAGRYHVTVPSWRATKDVTIKADIIEEITRIYGYDNFDVHTTEAPLYPVRPSEEKTLEDTVKDLLVNRYSLHEVHSYIWQYAEEMKALGMETVPNLRILGASNPNAELLRRSMIPTQLCQIKANLGYADAFGIFEIGRTVDGVDENNMAREHKMLGITLYSRVQGVEALYMRLRDALCELVDTLRRQPLAFSALEAAEDWQHPKNLNALLVDGKQIGCLGLLHPSVLKKLDEKAQVVYAEVDMDLLTAVPTGAFVYRVPSRYPGMEQDLTVLCDRYEPIAKAVEAVNSPLLQKIAVVSTFADAQGKSISVRLFFSHPERTLTSEEVQQVMDAVVARLNEAGYRLK